MDKEKKHEKSGKNSNKEKVKKSKKIIIKF